VATADRPRVAVVGAGITGLSAALTLAELGADVVVLEAADRPGGKIQTEVRGGVVLERGPDAFLVRVPEAVELSRRVGLGEELVPTGTDRAFIWTGGRLRPLPSGLVLGVPTSLISLAASGLMGPAGMARASLDLVAPPTRAPSGDRSVGEVVAARFGRAVLERLVDPLVGGIYAGRSEELSAAATTPQLDEASRSSRSLLLGLRAKSAPPKEGPVFMSLRGGLHRLVARAVELLDSGGHELRSSTVVEELAPSPGGWRLSTMSGDLETDAVVVTVPAPGAAGLLAGVAPAAAAELSGIGYASVAVVSLVYPNDALDKALDGSGFLVPRVEGRLVTACTWTSSKWPHLETDGRIVLRASSGRSGDERALDMSDAELTEAVHDELREAMGLRSPPLVSRATRWPGALPQYRVGHLERVVRIEEELRGAPGLAVAGAALRGVGIPACIRQGSAAASLVLDQLGAKTRSGAAG
jgi:protoporphyrinogen/coproporphyrinogen III oxidase